MQKRLNNSLLVLSRRIADNLFLSFMVVFSIALLISGILFYQYVILPQNLPAGRQGKEPVVSGQAIQLQENLYQNVLQEWQDRQDGWQAIQEKKYPNPFQP